MPSSLWRSRSLPEHPRMWLTTRDAARMLAVTPRWVRGLACTEQIAYERTRSGVFLFREREVLRLVEQRAKGWARSRPELLAAVRPKMLRASLEPRQARFRLVRSG